MSLDRGPTKLLSTVTERACAGLSTVAHPVHPCREENDHGPRPGQWPFPSLDVAPREALRLSSIAAPRCFETVSTTDVSRHEHPLKTPPSETARRAPWETRRLSASRTSRERGVATVRPGTAPDHLAVIRPPTVSGLTARDRLRDRPAATLAPKRVWGRAPQPCRLAGALPDRTLWHLCLRREEPRERPNTRRMSPFRSMRVNAADRARARGAFHRTRPARALLRGPGWSAAPAGRRGSRRTFSSTFENFD